MFVKDRHNKYRNVCEVQLCFINTFLNIWKTGHYVVICILKQFMTYPSIRWKSLCTETTQELIRLRTWQLSHWEFALKHSFIEVLINIQIICSINSVAETWVNQVALTTNVPSQTHRIMISNNLGLRPLSCDTA